MKTKRKLVCENADIKYLQYENIGYLYMYLLYVVLSCVMCWGTGVRGLFRGMAILAKVTKKP